jgi:predicted RNase H-like HicB family nuclease/DNA-binding XRE family transcriptional regulator
MQYPARISREGKYILADFPDCPGCQTFAESRDDLQAAAKEALEGWLEAHLVSGHVPPRPSPVSILGGARINVRPGLAAALNIRWARHEEGLSQSELGRRAGVSQQQIAKLENPDENPTVETLDKVARALRLSLDLTFSKVESKAQIRRTIETAVPVRRYAKSARPAKRRK